MAILSIPSSPTLLSPKLTSFSFLPPPATCFYTLRSALRRRPPPFAVVLCSSNAARGVVELLAAENSSLSSSHSRTFLDARSGDGTLLSTANILSVHICVNILNLCKFDWISFKFVFVAFVLLVVMLKRYIYFLIVAILYAILKYV